MTYDSFFISNGEPLENIHYELAKSTFSDLKWIQGINSRDLAIKKQRKIVPLITSIVCLLN